jgi:hypothetical protein
MVLPLLHSQIVMHYRLPTCNEIAGLIVGDIGLHDSNRHCGRGAPRRISEIKIPPRSNARETQLVSMKAGVSLSSF